ncbi:MAG: LysR family transcriptional regulator [Thermoleophilia bacterium]|nr:LysR family transcriptional regulator [Thermoleophilia bacterium]
MDLRHLRTLRTIVEKGSFSHAADALEISQPAVSFQIRSLEDALGHRLLDRAGRRVALTEAGEIAHRHARRMIAVEQELTRELEELGGDVAGPFVLGSSTGPGELVLPRILGRFAARHPRVTVSLVVTDTQSVCDRVLEDDLEMGVVGAQRPHRGLEFTPFMRDELVVIVPPSHAWARRDAVDVAELADEPVLMQQEGSGVRAVLEDALHAAGVRDRDLRVAMELGLQQSVKAAVLDGLGITVISRLAVEREAADGSLVALPVRGRGMEREFWVVRRANRTLRRAARAFLEFADDELATSAALPDVAHRDGATQ